MDIQYIIAIVWLLGFITCYWMLKVEHEAEGEEYTNGDKALQVLLSMLSVAMVFFLLVKAWAMSVKKYWSKRVKDKKAE
jgi:heme/copper-type cytochrome/quinol oxidase subunit 2